MEKKQTWGRGGSRADIQLNSAAPRTRYDANSRDTPSPCNCIVAASTIDNYNFNGLLADGLKTGLDPHGLVERWDDDCKTLANHTADCTDSGGGGYVILWPVA